MGHAVRAGRRSPPSGLTPILRLVGLIALAILVVVLLVFWIQGCQNDAKSKAYHDYMQNVSSIAKASTQTGKTLNNVLVTPGIKQAELEHEAQRARAAGAAERRRTRSRSTRPGTYAMRTSR